MNRIPLLTRRTQCVLVAALVTACGGSATTSGGEGGTGGAPGRSATLTPGSWQITAMTTPGSVSPGVEVCTTLQFTLNVGADGRATIGKDGRIDGTSAKIEEDVYTLGGLNLPCETVTTLSGLTLRGTDTDGDGKADTLTGTGQGMAFSGGGDIEYSEPVTVALTGTPDVTPPSLFPPESVNPLTSFAIAASEPLAATASLSLVGAPSVALTGVPAVASDNGPLTSFIEWSTDVILPLSGTWSIQGTAQDLSGLALVPAGVLQTLADPGVFARDGFEGTLIAASSDGTPTIVTGVGTLPAITGAHSLWITPGTTVTFHLERAKSEKTVHFAARAFSRDSSPSFSANIRAGVIGGRQIVQPSQALFEPETPVDTGDSTWAQATAVTQFDLVLTEPGTDVLLQLTPLACSGFCNPPSALMIDDLTLE